MNWKQAIVLLTTLTVAGVLGGVFFYVIPRLIDGTVGWVITTAVSLVVSYMVGLLGAKVSRWFE